MYACGMSVFVVDSGHDSFKRMTGAAGGFEHMLKLVVFFVYSLHTYSDDAFVQPPWKPNLY